MALIDAEKVVLDYLMTVAGVTTLTGVSPDARIYANAEWPSEYKPKDGAAILFGVRPGGKLPSHGATVWPQMQYQCCADTRGLAFDLTLALHDALHDKAVAGIKQSLMEGLPQQLPEPEPGWHIYLSAYKHWLVNS